MIYVWVGVAGAVGAVLRYLVGIYVYSGSVFPVATLITNLIGSFLLAIFTTVLVERWSLSPMVKTAIGTGMIGSFTTFSTLSVETVALFEGGRTGLAFLYIALSIFGGLFMSRIGFRLTEKEGAQ
ncbi:fluoride efflux transporter FluC [Rossellomorea marisflavi]|uniref:fluoride efflux transporter FluC n=1 Tax=Rossellomorea marisflavi TaxID=189381 RepID=UPI003AE7643C